MRCAVNLLICDVDFTFAHAVATIVAFLSWSSWTAFLWKEVCFVSHRLTCGSCARNALPIFSPAKFATSLCIDHPAPMRHHSFTVGCLHFVACTPSQCILPLTLSFAHMFHLSWLAYCTCTHSIHVYMFHNSSLCIYPVICCSQVQQPCHNLQYS